MAAARAGCPARAGSASVNSVASRRASMMMSLSACLVSLSSFRLDRLPACAEPSTSPSLRCSRSSSESANPSVVAATAASLSLAGMAAAADPAAKLMELRDAEPVGIHDHHCGGVRNVDTDLDDGCGHEHVDLAIGEGQHDLVFLFGRPLPVPPGKAHLGERALRQVGRDVEHRECRPALGLAIIEFGEVEATVFC